MSDYMDFEYTLKQVTTFCANDESLVYTPYYKFGYPNSHRVQGGLRTKDGKIEGALILFPDSDDKNLVWPVELEFHLLANINGNLELLGTRQLKWECQDAEEKCEEIQWKKSVCCSLEELKYKNLIDNDNSVNFVWAVKLLFPDPKVASSKPAKQPKDVIYYVPMIQRKDPLKRPNSFEMYRSLGSVQSGKDKIRKSTFSQQRNVSMKSVLAEEDKPTLPHYYTSPW